MCVDVTYKWPCGHRLTQLEPCYRAQGVNAVYVRRTGGRPMMPCDELAKETREAPGYVPLCFQTNCTAHPLWSCCKCQPIGGSDAHKVGGSDAARAPSCDDDRTNREKMNTSWRCGSSVRRAFACGHKQCGRCAAWRACPCPCGSCNQLIPTTRHRCETCVEGRCSGGEGHRSAALDKVLAATAARLAGVQKQA